MNWWVHAVVILAFMALIPASKHFHLVLSPITVFLKSPELGNLPNLDFEKEQVGLETVKDLGSKIVLDAFTCVECGRCQVNCPAWGAARSSTPRRSSCRRRTRCSPASASASSARSTPRRCCGSARPAAPARTSARSASSTCRSSIGARRGLVSNGDAPEYLGAVYNNLERRGNIWGLGYDQRQKFVESAELETFDPTKHDVLVWLGCAGAFDADFQKSLRSLFEILRARA